MKLGKIILPALLAIGAVSGFAFAKQAEEKQLAPAAALTYAGDYEIDRRRFQSGSCSLYGKKRIF